MGYCIEFMKYSPLDSYFYYKTLKLYESLFGRERLHLLLFEDFVQNRKTFVADLCKVLRIDREDALRRLSGRHERRRKSRRELRYHRFRSSLGRTWSTTRPAPFGKAVSALWQRFLNGGAPAKGFMSDYWRDRIVKLYQADNRKVARDFGLPLNEYGYPVG
jgi:hypothetical protein